MNRAALLGAIAGGFGLGLAASSAMAAPLGGVALQREPAPMVEKVHGGCHRHHRFCHCRRRHRHFHAGFFPFFSPFIGFGFRLF
jgi:hypothetical protein